LEASITKLLEADFHLHASLPYNIDDYWTIVQAKRYGKTPHPTMWMMMVYLYWATIWVRGIPKGRFILHLFVQDSSKEIRKNTSFFYNNFVHLIPNLLGIRHVN
jgi:hypothetical protein